MVHGTAQADEPEPAGTPAAFLHMRAAARRYLLEPGTFRKQATLYLTYADRTPERQAQVQSGFRQIIAWRGFHPDAPFRDLGVGGFYALLWLLHFQVVKQTAQPVDPNCFLDIVDVLHEELDLALTLYNVTPRALAPKGQGSYRGPGPTTRPPVPAPHPLSALGSIRALALATCPRDVPGVTVAPSACPSAKPTTIHEG